jgi:lantibiotic modifying enzyme
VGRGGTYRCDGVFCGHHAPVAPSLFLGTTGIGYQLLRLARVELPSILAFE